MPIEDDTVTSGPTTSGGDRLNKGDQVYMLGAPVTSNSMGAAEFTEECGNAEITLNASKLVASSFLLAGIALTL